MLRKFDFAIYSFEARPACELLVAKLLFMPLMGLIYVEIPFTESCGNWLDTELLFKSIEAILSI